MWAFVCYLGMIVAFLPRPPRATAWPPRNTVGEKSILGIHRRRAAAGGTWVIGSVAGHRFEALVFPDHAECEEYELGESRISKLWIQILADHQTVANFDRGWDILPKSNAVWAIVDFLAAGLADLIYA